MKEYEFSAVTAGADRIMGLSFPAVFGFVILAVQLGMHYTEFGKNFRTRPRFMIMVILFVFYFGKIIMKRIQRRLVKKYNAELSGRNLIIRQNGKEILSGSVLFCEIRNRAEKSLRVDIRTDLDKISFRIRPKILKPFEGGAYTNPFGTGDTADMEVLLSLGEAIRSVL